VVRKTAFVAVGLLLSGVGSSAADRAPRARDGAKRVQGKVVPHEPRPLSRTPQRLLGDITYDTGINAGFHPDVSPGAPNQNRTVGNRFNSAYGLPLLMTGMVWRITAFPASSANQSVSLADIPTTMNTAMVLVFVNAPMMANQFNAIVLNPGVSVQSDFLGMFVGQFNFAQNLLLGMSDMSTMGQGYHAIQAFYTAEGGGLQTMIEVVPNRNAMLRVNVDILVPVELMEFRIQ
jgi:hypothetical protein